MKEALLSWSSGKDSAWALQVLRVRPDVRVRGLLTTLNRVHERVVMHAVRESLLDAQAEAVGLPLRKIYLPSPCSNEVYEAAMARAVDEARAEGIDTLAFGDLHLEDVRKYRERCLAGTGVAPDFPLWGAPTRELAHRMLASGLKAYVTCVDPRVLDRSFAGRAFDEEFLEDLPESVDPCGENGEFHSFAYDGPMFHTPLTIVRGDVVERDGFLFADLNVA